MTRKITVLGLLAMMALSANAQQQQPDSVADGKTPARVYFQNGKVHFRSDNGKFHLWLDNRVNL